MIEAVIKFLTAIREEPLLLITVLVLASCGLVIYGSYRVILYLLQLNQELSERLEKTSVIVQDLATLMRGALERRGDRK